MRPISTRRVSKEVSWVAPTGGWRTDVELADMPNNAAFQLDNFFPEANRIRARYGSQIWCQGMEAAVETLIPYSGAASKFFAAAGAKIYDISSAGTTTTAVSGLSNAHWSVAQFTNTGGKFIRAVNGTDTPLVFDGTTWGTTPVITGPSDARRLSVVTAYRSRLWFIERDTTKVWYLATDAIGGAANSLEVGDVMKYGGTLAAIGVWTIPVASGLLQTLVIMSSEGELIVFQGSNPASASDWSLLGTFKLGKPLGYDRCFLNVGADLAILTVDAIIPITKAISLDRGAADLGALTKGIAPTWLETVADAGSTSDGWQLIGYPRRRMAIVNIPSSVGNVQYVMNTETGAWCRYLGLSATCWGVWNDSLYFGDSSGTVMQAESGASDNGAAIDAFGVGAFQRFGSGMSPKFTKMITAHGQTGPSSRLFVGVSTDYQAKTLNISGAPLPTPVLINQARFGTAIWGTSLFATATPSSSAFATAGAAKWDAAIWDDAKFPGTTAIKVAKSVGSVGVALAPTFRAIIAGDQTTNSEATVIGGSILYELGAPV